MGRIDELIEAVADEVGADTTVLLDDSVRLRQLAIDRLVDLATALSMRNLADLDRRHPHDHPLHHRPPDCAAGTKTTDHSRSRRHTVAITRQR